MSEATHPTGGLTRRGFLKTTGAAAAGLACAGAVGVAIGGGALAPARATADAGEKTITPCTSSCAREIVPSSARCATAIWRRSNRAMPLIRNIGAAA